MDDRLCSSTRTLKSTDGGRPASGGALRRKPVAGVDLDELARASIFFGHQSVGSDILSGVRELMYPRSPVWQDALIGENTRPFAKIEAFRRAFENLSENPSVALFKFCYVDFEPSTDERLVFDAYAATIASLQQRAPDTTFVHVTTPLTSLAGPGVWLRRMIRTRSRAERANRKRAAYNELLRSAYRGAQPIFDLAAVESGQPLDANCSGRSARRVPRLRAVLTEDGAHLNRIGQIVVAEQLLRVLTEVLRARSA